MGGQKSRSDFSLMHSKGIYYFSQIFTQSYSHLAERWRRSQLAWLLNVMIAHTSISESCSGLEGPFTENTIGFGGFLRSCVRSARFLHSK